MGLQANIKGTYVDVEDQDSPLWWQKKGLSFTASGYGRRIPTSKMVRLPGETRWRRVYCAIYSNIGTCYVEDRKNRDEKNRPGWIIIN